MRPRPLAGPPDCSQIAVLQTHPDAPVGMIRNSCLCTTHRQGRCKVCSSVFWRQNRTLVRPLTCTQCSFVGCPRTAGSWRRRCRTRWETDGRVHQFQLCRHTGGRGAGCLQAKTAFGACPCGCHGTPLSTVSCLMQLPMQGTYQGWHSLPTRTNPCVQAVQVAFKSWQL